ncbi:MAG: FtsQ-type POTRA domain-containing protein [Magnetococcales bacterium]|nr:FtsQ-type POTRA domain-containing protein [Magnetococcales bacterium]
MRTGSIRVRRAFVGLFTIGLLIWGWVAAHQPGRFPLKEIQVQGMLHTDPNRALMMLGAPEKTNLLLLELDSARERLGMLPWVKGVRMERLLTTGALSVTLWERTAVCLGRDGERLVVLDEYGKPIKRLEPQDPLPLPVVTQYAGDDASVRTVRLMNLLGEHPWLKGRLSEVIGLSNERWVLYTMKGTRLLFSDRIRQEMDLLRKLQMRFQLLDRRIAQVDLRIPGKVAVRPVERSTSKGKKDPA